MPKWTRAYTICIFILFSLLHQSTFSQERADSLENLLQVAKHDSTRIELLMKLSRIYRYKKPSKSLLYSDESIKLAESSLNKRNIALAHISKALVLYRLGDYDESFIHFESALEFSKEIQDTSLISSCYNNLASIYSIEDDDSTALSIYKKSLELVKNSTDARSKAIANMNIGMSMTQLMMDSALFYYHRSIELSKSIGLDYGEKLGMYNLGQHYLLNKDTDRSLEFLHAGLDSSLLDIDPMLYATFLYALAETYLFRDEINKAEAYLSKGLEAEKHSKNIENKQKHLYLRYQIDSILGDHEKALKSHIAYFKLIDSIKQVNEKERLTNFKVLHEVDQHHLQIMELEAKHKRTRIIAISSIVITSLLIALIISGVFFYKRKNALLRKLAKQNSSLQELNSTKDKFFTIIAHDLKNPINAIHGISSLMLRRYSQINDDKRLKYVKSLNQASQNFQYLLAELLDWSRSQTNHIKYSPTQFELNELLDTVKLYFSPSLENKKLTLKAEIPPTYTINADYHMVFTILRNLVSNAIKYSHDNQTITIRIEDGESHTKAMITDNGIGLSEKQAQLLFSHESLAPKTGTKNEMGTGLGLSICRDFVKRHNGEIGVESRLNGGSTFWFTIPKITSI